MATLTKKEERLLRNYLNGNITMAEAAERYPANELQKWKRASLSKVPDTSYGQKSTKPKKESR